MTPTGTGRERSEGHDSPTQLIIVWRTTMQRFYIIITIAFAIAFLAIWFVFLRPVPMQTATGAIRGKTFRESGTYWQGQHGLSRGFRTPTPIEIAQAYVFEIEVAEMPVLLRYALNPTASEHFAIGDTVYVEYQTVGLPPFWTRSYVVGMEAEQ